MLKEKRWNPPLRICIGVFLLLFCNVVADVPATTSKNPSGPTTLAARPLLRKVTGNDETELSGVAPDRGVISAGHEAANNGSSGDDVNGEGKINSSREKVAATRFPLDSEKPTTSRSPGEVDKLVTSESVNHQQEPSNRKSRLSNSLDENSGKSLAVTSEKPLRLTRINEGVAKRGHEMTPSNRHDGQSEKKSAVEKVGEIVKEDHEINKNNVKATTVRSVLREVQKTLKETKKKRVEDFDVKESEEFELEDDDENQEKFEDDNISLINDTRVNYSFLYKSRGNQNGENSLNRTGSDAIAKGVDLHEKQDPKKDVEIVKDIESLPSQRLVMENITNNENKRGNKSDISKENSEDSKEEILEKEGQSNNFNVSSESSSSESDDSEEKSSLSSAESTAENEKSTEYNTSINALSRGRTIGFSSENVFSNSEMKTTETNGYKATESLSLNNSEKEVPFEQRPYPYLKSSKNFSDEFKPNTVAGGKEEKKTNEPTPFENAIGQNQSEKKFVVTEPSVVIENSIQQVKPKDPKSSSNWTVDDGSEHFVSIVSSTVSPSTTSQNFLKQVEPSKSVTSIVQGKEDDTRKPFDAENVVPNGSKDEIKPTVIVKTGNFDVTGNAITEINRKLLETAVNVTETTEKAFLHSQGFSTEKVTTTSKLDSSKPDVQTNAEESMLIRSSFNVSEESTEFPLTMNDETTILAPTTSSSTENATVASSVTMAVKPVTSSSSSTTVTSRNLVTESLKNLMQRKTTVIDSTTLNADETSIPTTTRIEYEFVGLTDAIVSENDVTESSNSSISLTTTSGTNTESSNDQTIVTTESSEITSATENVTETSSTEETVTKDTEGTTVVTEETEPTTFETTASEFLQTTTVSESTLESTGMNSEESKITESIPPTTSESIDKKIVIPSTESLKPTTMIVTEDFTATESTTVTTTTEKINSIPGTVTTWSTVTWTNSVSSTTVGGNGPTQRIAEQTTEIVPTLSNDEITSLVRIVVEGTWREVCPRLPELRQSLADILTTGIGTDKQVMPKQIVFHQSPCLESNLSLSTSSEDSLISMLIYVVDENGKFDEEMTKVLPSLYYKVSPINFPVTIHSFLLVQETDSGNAIAAVVISSVAFICLLLLAGLLFIMRKRQTRFNYGERCRPVSLDAYSLDSVPACNSVRRKGAARSSKRSYGNPTFEDSSVIPSHPLNFTGLSSFCGDVNAITEEFSGVPQVSAKMDELPSGAEVKNRYANVVPLPETRVPLQRIGNDPLTEYINANYVRGPKNAMKYYIACQAPMESTVIDFWRMIWEQQTKVIIMLTDLVENGVEKCHEYIPPSEVTDCHRLFGDFQVTLKKRETKEKYAISTLHLKNLENNTFREVYHIWYLWPVNGVQSDGAGLIAVLLEARALQRGGPGPIVVHCSPGTGRTGTLIALDLGIRQYEITRTVDVPRVVYTIRRDRAGAVQTKEQYAFIYKALNLYATKLAGGVLEST